MPRVRTPAAPAAPELPFPAPAESPAPAETPAAPKPRKPRATHAKKPGSRSSRRAAVRAEREERQTAAVMASLGSPVTDVATLVATGLHAMLDADARKASELDTDGAVLFGVKAARAACPADYWDTVGADVAAQIQTAWREAYAMRQIRADIREIKRLRAARPGVPDDADPARVAALRRLGAMCEAGGIPVPAGMAFDEDAYLAAHAGNPFPGARIPTRRGPRKAKPAGDAAPLHGAPVPAAGKATP